MALALSSKEERGDGGNRIRKTFTFLLFIVAIFTIFTMLVVGIKKWRFTYTMNSYSAIKY